MNEADSAHESGWHDGAEYTREQFEARIAALEARVKAIEAELETAAKALTRLNEYLAEKVGSWSKNA